jgi:hypothetical protein
VSIGKLNFAAQDWILGGWVVLKNKVCYHNYTTPANERGPGRQAIAAFSLFFSRAPSCLKDL